VLTTAIALDISVTVDFLSADDSLTESHAFASAMRDRRHVA
jgi:hypothetical protein